MPDPADAAPPGADLRAEVERAARDFRPWSEALLPALAGDPFYRTLEAAVGGGAAGRTAMLRYFDCAMRDAERFGLLTRPEGEARGAALWLMPLDADAAARRTSERDRLLGAAVGAVMLSRFRAINAAMAATTGRVVSAGDWYLSILGVAPCAQGTGLGRALMAPALARADAAGAACYLETFERENHGFYARLGFVEAAAFDEPVTGARYHVLRRAPQGAPTTSPA